MLDINGIMEIIPQRAPFLMIDKVEEFVPGESCTAYKNVCIACEKEPTNKRLNKNKEIIKNICDGK